MISSNRWWTRVSAAVAAMIVTVLAPAAAWAETSGAADLVRKRKSSMGFGTIFGGLCCLVVVGIIVVVVVLVLRKQKNK